MPDRTPLSRGCRVAQRLVAGTARRGRSGSIATGRAGRVHYPGNAAASLVRLLRDPSRPTNALALLGPVYDRFSEGFETVPEIGKNLLDAFGHAQ